MNSNSREYTTYACNCGYTADVFGTEEEAYYGTYETHVCLNCKILIECETVISEIDKKENCFVYHPCIPICLVCGLTDVILWDNEMCKCPKCEDKMNLTRLELNIDGIKTFRII